MSYMDHNASFAPAGGIQELSFDEIVQVDGAIAPVLLGLAAVVVVGAVCAGAYYLGRSQGLC